MLLWCPFSTARPQNLYGVRACDPLTGSLFGELSVELCPDFFNAAGPRIKKANPTVTVQLQA